MISRLACFFVIVHLFACTAATLAVPAPENARCFNCHGNPDLAKTPPTERQSMVRAVAGVTPRANAAKLYVAPVVFKHSVHGDGKCTSCHPDCETLPHPIRTAEPQCKSCHANQYEQYTNSVHGQAVSGGEQRAAHCHNCHGSHDILSSQNPQSRTFKLQLAYTCATCHSNTALMKETKVHQPEAAAQYMDSMHGRGLIADGLLVAPSCSDCHGAHSIWPASDPRSTINKQNVPKTCGKCHMGVEETYRKSVHGKLLQAGDSRGPVCATCHTAHRISNPGTTAFKLHSDERCGQCHADRLERYRETFHGKAIALGRPSVAACYDCHGHHDIMPISDAGSRLSPEHKLQTCQKCHPKATQKFTEYIAHADHTDRANYPILYWTFMIMTSIVLGTFAFFGVHTLLWLVRSTALYLRDPQAFRHAKSQAMIDSEVYVRFRPFERFLHVLVVSSFLLLVATGMPLKFYHAGWAHWLVNLMGGLEVAGALHRLGAVITFVYFGLHLTSLARALIRRRADYRDPQTGRFSLRQFVVSMFGPDMPLPNLDDLRDWWAHQKWFFGRGPRPQFDKWTYWEKFDYFAVFWGVAIIGFSGLIMWFPVQFTWILPGWIINVAMIIHSDEALLAAGFIFTFHFFNVHFRPEKFPMDPVIFSGRMSRTEMLHERKRWYDRLVKSGQIDKIRLRDEWSQWKRVMHPLGFLAFSTGVALLLLIFYAMSTRLFIH